MDETPKSSKVEITKEMWLKSNILLVVLLIVMLGLYMAGMCINTYYHRKELSLQSQELTALHQRENEKLSIDVNKDGLTPQEEEDRNDLIEVSPWEQPLNI